MASVIIKNLKNSGGGERRVELSGSMMLIGRRHDCEIRIGEKATSVSRRHARLTRVKSTWYVEDFQSRNHTYVNDRRLDENTLRPLVHGDRIRICQYQLDYDCPAAVKQDSGSVSVLNAPSATVQVSAISGAQVEPRLSALVQVVRSLRNVLSLDDVFEDILAALLRLFPAAQRGIIGFWEKDQFLPKWWSVTETAVNREIKVSRTVIQQVATQNKAALFTNAPHDLGKDGSVAQLCSRSIMCAPLVTSDGQVFGAFQLDCDAVAAFSGPDLELFETVAVQAAFSISFAKLHAQAVRQRIIERDVALARDVQNEFLPKDVPQLAGYEFAHHYEPARHIGGDYFDYLPLEDGRLAILLGDVGGKGAPAALYMARMVMVARQGLRETNDPADAMGHFNRHLTTRFATFVLCVLDPANHTLTIVNAGHRTPLRRTTNGAVDPLGEDVVTFPFGTDSDIQFEAATTQLLPGETVIVFSDGFEDAYNQDTDERFGVKRVQDALARDGVAAARFIPSLVQKIREFAGGTLQFDDMCIVGFTRQA